MKKYLENIREVKPIIHNITNFVTVNDCANIVLACGASPIMADEREEVEEITSICKGLNINLGTLNRNILETMILAGKKSNDLKHPVVLDPVGVGASTLRTNSALKLIDEVDVSVIRGNISEIKTLLGVKSESRGVDASESDRVTEENLDEQIALTKDFSRKTGSVIAITGAIDIVCDSEKAFVIRNGHPMMSSITGTGCQLSALIASYISANTDDIIGATAAAVCAMGLAGEIAHERLGELDGNSSYRNYIIDAIYNMTPEQLENGAKFEIR